MNGFLRVYITNKIPTEQIRYDNATYKPFDSGYLNYLAPRPFAALAKPLARVPRTPPRAVPPLAVGIPPRPVVREAGAGVENFGVGLEEVGGFSTKDVSVVLEELV